MKKMLLAFIIYTLNPIATTAISVSISQSGTAANSCTRTLTAHVSGGSGNYIYTWSIVDPSMPWPGTNNVATVNIALAQTVDVNVSVHDVILNQYDNATVTVYRTLEGGFNTFQPNLITPNGDGINDTWIVTAADKTFSPLNAFAYTLTIRNSSNVVVYSDSNTITSGHLGIIGGDIEWNARVGGTGSIVPVGIYSYQLYLENCSTSTTYSSSLQVLY